MITFGYMERQEKFVPVHKGAKGIRATCDRAMRHLVRELRMISASDVVIECGYPAELIKRDGTPNFSRTPRHGQVRLSFKAKGAALSLFFGGWVEFEQNLYMISLTLERLRAVDRYGCTQSGEQYRGFAQLPPGGVGTGGGIGGGGNVISVNEWIDVGHAMRWLSGVGDDLHSELPEDLETVYRQAAKRAHPDAGGSAELMSKVNRARAFVRIKAGL